MKKVRFFIFLEKGMRKVKIGMMVLMLSLFTGFMQVSAHTGVQLRVLNLPFAFSGMTSFTLELEIEENAFD